MRHYKGQRWTKQGIAKIMSEQANRGTFDGKDFDSRYVQACKGHHPGSGSILIFSRDTTMHTSGWFKNPDYERCFHLSLSFYDPESQEIKDQDHALAQEWATYFFGENRRLLWVEPPHSSFGKIKDVYHYRLFCNQYWEPILPRGEVYTKKHTPAGWKSFSDVQAEIKTRSKVIEEIARNR